MKIFSGKLIISFIEQIQAPQPNDKEIVFISSGTPIMINRNEFNKLLANYLGAMIHTDQDIATMPLVDFVNKLITK